MATFPLRFPNIKRGFPVVRRPKFASIVSTAASGREIRAAQQIYPTWEFELTFEFLRDMTQNEEPWWNSVPYTEFQEISQLFLNCRGQFGTFLYSDSIDNSRANGFINFGDGSTTVFTVPRYWGFGNLAFPEPVGNVDRIDNLYLNGVVQPEISYSISGNLVTISPAPGNGVSITADFKFSYLCRFLEDMHEYSQFMYSLWEFKRCRFKSLKLPDLPGNLNVIDLTDGADAILTVG